MIRISNELSLLLKLTDRTVNFDPLSIESELKNTVNWENFISIAKAHKLFLPAMNFLVNYEKLIPPHIFKKLLAIRLQLLKRQMLIDFEANNIIKVLNDNGVEAVLFKGSNLAKDIYGNINDRMTGDIDIFCKMKNFSEIRKLIEKNNFMLKEPYNNYSAKRLDYTIRHKKDISFINKSNRIRIELHWKINTFNLLNKDNSVFEYDNLKHIATNQLSQDFVLYLIIHGAIHNWMRLFWLRDIYHIVFNHSELFKHVVELAQKHKGEFYIRLVANMIEEVYGVKIPNLDYKSSENDNWMKGYCLESIEKYDYELSLKDVFRRALYLSRLRNNLAYKIKVFRNLFVKADDLELLNLSDNLLFLSYPLAPFFRLFRYIELRQEWKRKQAKSL